jgi:small subunit ribosomal protein S8
MSMTDPIADMLTRIRNAVQAKHKTVSMPASNLKVEVARILKEEGYIADYRVSKDEGKGGGIDIRLKYNNSKKSSITSLKKVSKPGLRIYVGKDDVPRVLNGLGIAIISTSRGLMTDKAARETGVGGEVICTVF